MGDHPRVSLPRRGKDQGQLSDYLAQLRRRAAFIENGGSEEYFGKGHDDERVRWLAWAQPRPIVDQGARQTLYSVLNS